MGPHPAVAAIRLAVRRTLTELAAHAATGSTFAAPPPTPPRQVSADPTRLPRAQAPAGAPLVLVACSGGADSMALAVATAFEAPKLGLRAGAVTVDHGLQPGSADRAQEVADRLRGLGLDPVEAVTVDVGHHGGPEAAARTARYAAMDDAATRHDALAVLLGHTRDDQAETVLLGLARGSGARSLAGMPPRAGRYRRPLLEVGRAATRQACVAQGVTVWDDPHNTDPAFTRSRVRHEVLPVLEKHLGGGVVEALARTARLFRDDADALDSWAAEAEQEMRAATDPEGSLDADGLAALPPAVRRRVLRRAAVRAGSPPGDLFARHLEAIEQLVTGWRGQGPLHLPGGVEARRRCGRLLFRTQTPNA
ncbi:tRNA lysidine(34) synthetase TilS [Streptomyces sp. NPDC092296]|uniref:tRNA lysidine(34) synthetase TilS n=1 Tax=Streptomyces sp. NPDC092296 TaxID=3366012 RepID=UPI00380BC723